MYENRTGNIGFLAGTAAVFVLAPWLVRSQETISDISYVRAIIPRYHAIAVMMSDEPISAIYT